MFVCIVEEIPALRRKEEVLQYLRQLDDRRYIVIKQDFYNKQNHPRFPVLIFENWDFDFLRYLKDGGIFYEKN